MFRSISIIVTGFVLYSGAVAVSQENSQLTVVAFNDAGIPAAVLRQAEEITHRIFKEAGIRLVWKDRADPKSDPIRLFVRIVPHSLNLPGEDFGIAFVGPDGRGLQADVFYSGIEGLAKNYSANPAEILGHVMAHELGHLLLGMNSHSSLGIMQAHWSERQLHEMSRGALKFNKSQSRNISSRLHLIHVPEIEAALRTH